MNGFDPERKPPVSSTSTPTRRPDAAKPANERDKKSEGQGQTARPPDFSTLRMRAQDEQSPIAATGQQATPAQGAPGLPAAPVAAVPLAAAGNGWTETIDRFVHDRATLTPAHRSRLQALAAAIATRLALAPGSRVRIHIDGHTDTSGDETHNQDLGQQRADAAKAALELALGRYGQSLQTLPAITTRSLGESSPVNPTGDGVKDAGNRRVQIRVTIEGPAAPSPKPAVQKEKKPPIKLTLPPDYDPTPPGPRRRGGDWWQRAEENQRRIDEFDRRHPPRSRSLNDVLVDGVTKVLEPVIAKLPRSLQNKARDGIRAGIEKGTQAGCDAAIDASGVTGEQAEAIKAACHAALQTKPGRKPR